MSDSILYGQSMAIEIVFKLWGNSNFVFLMKERVTQKKINLPKCLGAFCQGMCQELFAIFNLVEIKTSIYIYIFGIE